MQKTVSNKQTADCCNLSHLIGDFAPRLFQMVTLPGSDAEIVRIAPLGFPMEINIHGNTITDREKEARCIEIES